jgi:hypothetical protein
MSFDKRRWIIGAALLAMSACQVDDDVGEIDAVFRDFTPDLPPWVTSELCTGHRQVAITNTGDCPAKAGWNKFQLFGATAGDEYEKYCVYDWNGSGNLATRVTTIQADPAFDEIASECVSVRMQGQLVTTLNPELRELTKDRIDTVTDAQIGLPGTKNSRGPTLVTVFDTIPAVRPTNPTSSHGIQVADFIKDIARGCNNIATCNVGITTSLGLPRTGPDRQDIDLTHGGFAAMPSDLAIAINNTITTWGNLPEPRPNIILNLSIGWLRAFGGEVDLMAGDLAADTPPGIKAMRLAIERARCHGVLIIAAAGNSKNDCETDPVMPGEWERLPAPDATRCTDVLEVQVPADLGGSDYHPLVYSVGGIDFHDQPITVTRPGGRPRLAAFAENVVGPDLTYGAASGTSMAAAAVTGTAALVWSFKPNWGPDDVMDEIYESGTELALGTNPIDADYGAEDAIHPIHKVTACKAIESACAGFLNCPPTVNVDCVDTPKSLTELEAAVDALVGDVPPVELAVESIGECPYYCSTELDAYAVDGEGCPALEADQQLNFIAGPQPDDLACATCTWETNNTSTADQETIIWASLTKGFQGRIVADALVSLVLDDGTSGGDPKDYPLGPVTLLYGTKTPLYLTEDAPTLPIRRGTITLAFVDGTVTTDVLVPGATR